MWFPNVQELKGSLSPNLPLAWSSMEPSTTLFLPTLLAQQGLFLTSYLHNLLGNNFLDIIPNLCPRHCKTQCCLCETKSSAEARFFYTCQDERAKDFGFFCCLVSHLTQCPEIYCENFSASQPLSLQPRAIFHSTQLQFLQGFYFATDGPPSLQALAAYTLLQTAYQAGRYPEARIMTFVDAQSRGIHPSVGRLIIGHKLYRRGIPPKESPSSRSAVVQTSSPGHLGRTPKGAKGDQRCQKSMGW